MDPLPPSYNEAIGAAAFYQASGNSGVIFCARCGHRSEGSQQCASCGYLLVQSQPHVAFYNPAISHPPNFPIAPSSMASAPPSMPSAPNLQLAPSIPSIFPSHHSPSPLPQPSIDPPVINKQPLPSETSDSLDPSTVPLVPTNQPTVISKEPIPIAPVPDPPALPEETPSCPGNSSRSTVTLPKNPPKAAKRNSKDMAVRLKNRLYIDFEKHGNRFFEHAGLHGNVKDNIPAELKRKGIKQSEWKDWMVELNEIQNSSPSICRLYCQFLFPLFIPQCFLCAMFCPISYNHPLSCLPCCYGEWHEKLRQWQRKVNTTLNRRKMHAKLVTYRAVRVAAPKSKLYSERIEGHGKGYEISYLVIALNKEESMKLIDENWFNGFDPNGCMSDVGRAV